MHFLKCLASPQSLTDHWRRCARSLQIAGGSSGGYSLRLPLRGTQHSVVTLEVAADDVSLVVNRSPAAILSWQVCTFNRTVCGGFEALGSKVGEGGA
jgi:hypothetical protein